MEETIKSIYAGLPGLMQLAFLLLVIWVWHKVEQADNARRELVDHMRDYAESLFKECVPRGEFVMLDGRVRTIESVVYSGGNHRGERT